MSTPDSTKSRIFSDRQHLARYLAIYQAGARSVFTNGCFDILHRGHATYLTAARALGDFLIVGLNSDRSVGELKGPTRPIHCWEDRAYLLASLRAVDYVVFFDEDTPIETIACLTPSIHVKGGDYRPETLPETATVLAGGGEVVILDFVEGHSTSSIIERART